MNKKGFTLVELLATLIVLSIITGITITSIITSMKNARTKTEEEFLNQVSNSVDSYVNLCLGGLATNSDNCEILTNLSNKVNDYIYYNCASDSSNIGCPSGVTIHGTIAKRNNRNVNVYKNDQVMFSFSGVLGENILDEIDFINPATDKSCLNYNGNHTKIKFYIDADYVYYYEIDLPKGCIEYHQQDNDKYYVVSTLEDLTSSNALDGGLNGGQIPDGIGEITPGLNTGRANDEVIAGKETGKVNDDTLQGKETGGATTKEDITNDSNKDSVNNKAKK